LTSKTDASLRKLSKVSQELNKVSDDLSKELTAIEKALNTLNLGVSAWLRLSSERSYDDGVGSYLTDVVDIGYARVKGKWGLVYLGYCDEMGIDEGMSAEPLHNASRKIRIDAVEKLPELIDRLSESALKTTTKAQVSVAKAREISNALSEGRS
jgi:hypothetical protein